MTHGLIIGRFLPPHGGHMLLAETASGLVDRLTILLCWNDADAIPGPLRTEWLRALFPQAIVSAHHHAEPPVDSDARIAECLDAMGTEGVPPVDLLFTADTRAGKFAERIGARLVLIDPDRETMPVTGTDILADPLGNWECIAPPARPHFARSICLHGPESTGKSTLAPQLARHFKTIHLPEYGRTYCENFGLALSMRDLVEIGRTHVAMTHAALKACNRRLILDTDPLMTAAWADMLFAKRDPWFDAFQGTADLYLLLDIDMPWVDDGTRFFGDDARRRRFFDLSRAELERRKLPYAVIGGPPEQRFDRALEAIDAAGLG